MMVVFLTSNPPMTLERVVSEFTIGRGIGYVPEKIGDHAGGRTGRLVSQGILLLP